MPSEPVRGYLQEVTRALCRVAQAGIVLALLVWLVGCFFALMAVGGVNDPVTGPRVGGMVAGFASACVVALIGVSIARRWVWAWAVAGIVAVFPIILMSVGSLS
jgi:hypothetical protein